MEAKTETRVTSIAGSETPPKTRTSSESLDEGSANSAVENPFDNEVKKPLETIRGSKPSTRTNPEEGSRRFPTRARTSESSPTSMEARELDAVGTNGKSDHEDELDASSRNETDTRKRPYIRREMTRRIACQND
jgi:hypothetical protein